MDDEQTKLWNGPGARAWIDAQEVLDQLFAPFEDLLVAEAAAATSVLDVGCGTGSTTRAVARALGATGRSVGLDLSAPMIAFAADRAQRENNPARFVCADAQTHVFEPAGFDLIISRFGVMFFDDPVAAFANLRRAARSGGALRAIVWRAAAENPFMTTAERAAAPLLPALPPRRPGPGQFALADRARVESILTDSGWKGPDVAKLDVPCAFPEEALAHYVTRLGPVGQLLREADDHTRAQVLATVLPAFAPFIQGGQVRFTAACWMVAATA
jgi:SAM-dependent methyltransferase